MIKFAAENNYSIKAVNSKHETVGFL